MSDEKLVVGDLLFVSSEYIRGVMSHSAEVRAENERLHDLLFARETQNSALVDKLRAELALVEGQRAEFEKLAQDMAVRAATIDERAKDLEATCNDLTAVMDARFDAAMSGADFSELDKGVTAEQVAREHTAIVYVIEKLGPKWKALESEVEMARACGDVVAEARRLRDSGYDGPWIGEVCRGLYGAIAALERLEAKARVSGGA